MVRLCLSMRKADIVVSNESANIANPRAGKHNLEVIYVMRLELAAAQFDSGAYMSL
jgi:hypothetical protein